eukprot:4144010-Karenia_brevis.AAC.1
MVVPGKLLISEGCLRGALGTPSLKATSRAGGRLLSPPGPSTSGHCHIQCCHVGSTSPQGRLTFT